MQLSKDFGKRKLQNFLILSTKFSILVVQKQRKKHGEKKKNRDQEEEKEVTAQDLKGMNMLDLRVSYILKINLNKKINCFALFLCRLPLGYLI